MMEHIQNIIEKLNNEITIIEHFGQDKKEYSKELERYYDYMKQGFEFEELRRCKVHFKFFADAEYIHSLPLPHFITNMMFWEPMVRLDLYDQINDTFVVNCTHMSSDLIKDYIDSRILIPFKTQFENVKLNKVLHDMMFNLSRISTDFNTLMALSINTETFIDMANKNARFDEIIHTKVDEDMQPNEIEDYLEALTTEQLNIMINEDNLLQPILKSGTGIKKGQFKEFAVNGAMKPDLYGNTIPIPVNTNFMVGGLNKVSYYYIDSLGGRKAAIMNKTVMGKAGHFARKLMISTTPIRLSKKVRDCGTLHPVKFNITTKNHLERMRGRYYRLPHHREYTVMQGNEERLIGKTVLMRSPVKCASKDICHMCYGDLYYTNRDLNSVGAFASARIGEPLSQNVLSSKHLLTTQSEPVVFNEEFEKYFTIMANEIFLQPENASINYNDYSLIIIKENIEYIEQFDDNEFNSYIPLFHVRHNKTGVMTEFKEAGDKDLYLSPEIKDMMKKKTSKDFYEFNLSKFGDDGRIFVVEIMNNELTKPLYDIMDLLDNKKKRGEYNNIDKLVQRLSDLLIISNIDADFVHGEMIVRPLIRDGNDLLKTPDFSKYSAEDNYDILTIESSLINNPSVLVSLSSQKLKQQLLNPLTFKKTDSSFLDSFFREEL